MVEFLPNNRRCILVITAIILVVTVLVLAWQTASPVSVYTTGQCIFKSYMPVDSYTRSGKEFASISAVLDFHHGGGFSSATLPTDKASLHAYQVIYDQVMGAYKQPVATESVEMNLLEIGVKKGGSLMLFREYFHQGAKIYGGDIDPAITTFSRDPNMKTLVMDSTRAEEVARSFPPRSALRFDIIIDDGCHRIHCIQDTFRNLWPHLKDDGLYIIEDFPWYVVWPEYRTWALPHILFTQAGTGLKTPNLIGAKICVVKDPGHSREYVTLIYPPKSKAPLIKGCTDQMVLMDRPKDE